MRAVVVLPGRGGDGPPVTDRHTGPMLWVVDRPLVQHVTEALAARGVRSVDWVYPRADDDTRRLLGGGERWGLRFRHHVAAGNPYAAAAPLAAAGHDDPVLFGHADRLVELAAEKADPATTVLYGTRDAAGRWGWSGWAVLSAADARRVPHRATGPDQVGRVLAAGRAAWAQAGTGPAPRCLVSYLEANRVVLAAAGDGPYVPRSARVHPTARLVGPVHLGADVEVGPGAVVGPFVAVGPNTVVDRGAVLANAVVLPDTYVGPGLRLDGGVIDRHRVAGVGPDGRTVVLDRPPTASLTDHPLRRLGVAAARRAAAVAGVVRRVVDHPLRRLGAAAARDATTVAGAVRRMTDHPAASNPVSAADPSPPLEPAAV